METQGLTELLQRRWLHSHEEDTTTETVYRPDTFSFPRSRGRSGFELAADNQLVEVGIAPTDGPQLSTGNWRLNEQDGTQLVLNPASSLTRRLDILSVDKDRLVVKKETAT